MTDGDDLLDRILAQTPPADDAERRKAHGVIGEAIRQSLAAKPGAVVAGDVEPTIRQWQAEIDRALSAQLSAILHHPDFRRLEATWRGLTYLVMNTETDERLKLRVLNVGRPELGPAAVKVSADESIRLL